MRAKLLLAAGAAIVAMAVPGAGSAYSWNSVRASSGFNASAVCNSANSHNSCAQTNTSTVNQTARGGNGGNAGNGAGFTVTVGANDNDNNNDNNGGRGGNATNKAEVEQSNQIAGRDAEADDWSRGGENESAVCNSASSTNSCAQSNTSPVNQTATGGNGGTGGNDGATVTVGSDNDNGAGEGGRGGNATNKAEVEQSNQIAGRDTQGEREHRKHRSGR
jgi:hypothetical protein